MTSVVLYRRSTWQTILVVDILVFSIAAVVGQHPKPEWEEPIGATGRYGFLICTLALIVIALSRFLHDHGRRVGRGGAHGSVQRSDR